MTVIVIVLIFASVFISIYSIFSMLFGGPKNIDRLNKYFNPDEIKDEVGKDEISNGKKDQARKILNDLGTRISEILLMKKRMKNTQEELIKAGLLLRAEELLGIQVLSSLSITLLIYSSTRTMATAIILGLLGWILPNFLVKLRKQQRYKLFNDQLGDAITLISNSLKAGYSFQQAIDSVATEMPPPISDEFKKLLKELRLGAETEKALNNILKRVESDDFELLITAVIIQREIGSNLSEILDNISNTIRERIKLKGEINTLTAQGKISGLIVSLLPIVLGVILYIINPEYIMTLFKSETGIMIVGASVISQLMGILFIKKIIKIEV